MPERTRRVYFEVQSPTSGQSSRRARSADRVHSILDDYPAAGAGIAAAADMAGRDEYERLARENHYLRIELRDRQDAEAYAARLRAENAELRRENRELLRLSSSSSAAAVEPGPQDPHDLEAARRDGKLSRLRKKCARLEVELADWRAKADDWHRLYEEVNRGYQEARRRADAFLATVRSLEQSKLRLEQDNAALRRDLELERRLRRRPFG